MKELVIIGAGGFGREVAWLIERINAQEQTWKLVGFIDDNLPIGTKVGHYSVVGSITDVMNNDETHYAVCAIGNAKTRKNVIIQLEKNENIHFATVVDPTVQISDTAVLDEGCIVCAGTMITVDIHIKKHTIVNLDCTVGHDVVIEPFCTLYPSVNVSGMTKIGECSEIGTGANIIQGISIASESIVGAGSVVIKDLKDSGTYVGAPAKLID